MLQTKTTSELTHRGLLKRSQNGLLTPSHEGKNI
jgi:hypothetical protein